MLSTVNLLMYTSVDLISAKCSDFLISTGLDDVLTKFIAFCSTLCTAGFSQSRDIARGVTATVSKCSSVMVTCRLYCLQVVAQH